MACFCWGPAGELFVMESLTSSPSALRLLRKGIGKLHRMQALVETALAQ